MSEANENTKESWSWLGFFFTPHYYAGYGKIKKGAIYAIVGAFPLFGIIIGIIGGIDVNKDLPIGKQDFNWKNVAITVILTISGWVVLLGLI